MPVQTGLERCVEKPSQWIPGDRLGLLSNPASINSQYVHARLLISDIVKDRLVALYSPQHGFFGEKQDNMIESSHMIDPALGIQVFSLYGETRRPTEGMLEPIDTLVIDLQDAGTRVYTFISTMAYCMEAASAFGKKVIVLDRPNPIGGEIIEGNCVSREYTSLVSPLGLPMRYGMTIGELALYFNSQFDINCDLTVVPMKGWERRMYFRDTGLPWVAPSPNLPTPVSAMVYPGQVLWEGTNMSEGRGTTQPFEFFGAPYLDTEKILESLEPSLMSGIFLRPVCFEPTSNKWKGNPCNGFQIHITDKASYSPYKLTLSLIQAMLLNHPNAFEWKQPPYEYEYERMPIDLLIGDRDLRYQLEAFERIDQIETCWGEKLEEFRTISHQYHLY